MVPSKYNSLQKLIWRQKPQTKFVEKNFRGCRSHFLDLEFTDRPALGSRCLFSGKEIGSSREALTRQLKGKANRAFRYRFGTALEKFLPPPIPAGVVI